MLEGMRARLGYGLCLIVVLCSTCDAKVQPLAGHSEDKRTENKTLYHLDVKKPTLVQAVEPTDRAQDSKFVQVEVVEVKNPKNLVATFKVEYQTKDNQKVFLGTFTLYPSDNPGKFIVATKGQLRNEGAVVLTLVLPAELNSDDVLNVAVKRMAFLSN